MGFIKRIFLDRLWLSAAGVVMVFVVAVAYLFAAVLKSPLTERPLNVKVELVQTGGLFEGSAVTYRGVKVGKVTSVVPKKGGGVLAEVRLNAGTEIPADTMAKVRSLSPVGEQYLDFQPRTLSEPYLKNHAVIQAAATDIPTSLQSTVIAINKVLRQIDEKKLRVVLQELSTGLAGTGDDVGRLIDQSDQLLTMLEEIWPETDRLITNAGTVLDIGTDNATALRELGTNAKQFARFLRNYTPEWEQILRKTPGKLKGLEDVVKDTDEYLPDFLHTGATFSNMFRPWNPHLRALLQEYPRGLNTLSAVLAGSLRISVETTRTARCRYGTTWHKPTTAGTGFQTGGHCAASFPRLQRGAAHAPGPAR